MCATSSKVLAFVDVVADSIDVKVKEVCSFDLLSIA